MKIIWKNTEIATDSDWFRNPTLLVGSAIKKWRNRKTQCAIICPKNIFSNNLSEEYSILSEYLSEEYPILSNYLSEFILSYLNICQKNILSYLNICQKNIPSYLIICQKDGIDHRHLSLGLSRASYSAPANAVAEVHKIDYNQDMYTIRDAVIYVLAEFVR